MTHTTPKPILRLLPQEKAGYPVLDASVAVPDGMMPIVIHRRDSGVGLVLVLSRSGTAMADAVNDSRAQVEKKIAAWNGLDKLSKLYLVPGSPTFRNEEVHAAYLRRRVRTAKSPEKLETAILEAQRYAMARNLFWNVYDQDDLPVFRDKNGTVIQRVVIYDATAGL